MEKEREAWCEAGYESLALYIVRQAKNDYKEAKRRGNLGQVVAIQRFFRSDWCCLLCRVDGETIIEMIEKEIAAEDEKRKKQNGRLRRKKQFKR